MMVILPPEIRRPRRWTPNRKLEICRQIIAGEATIADAAQRHDLGDIEIRDWLRRYQLHGVKGLSVRRGLRRG